MKLVNKVTRKPLVEFRGEETVFHNKYLEREMRTMGVPVPHGMRGLFQGRDSIMLGEEGFQKAFKEIYYLTRMDTALFLWE